MPHRHPPSAPAGHAPDAHAPLLIGAPQAAAMCGRSLSSWWRDCAAGRVPRPVKLGGRVLWRVRELQLWVEGGCPRRGGWEALGGAAR